MTIIGRRSGSKEEIKENRDAVREFGRAASQVQYLEPRLLKTHSKDEMVGDLRDKD